jgi:uracil-DNA glycosylase family 4
VDKVLAYSALVDARKQCHLCDGLENPAVLEDGQFDSPHIGPWTAWLGDLNAPIMVVGQEWGDRTAFVTQRGIDSAQSPTNIMLRELLRSIGVDVPLVGESPQNRGVYITNAALCLKGEGCQGPVRPIWFRQCGAAFLRPQVELVRPRVVVTLGQQAYSGLLTAYGLAFPPRYRDSVEGPGVFLPSGVRVFAVYHCGRRILNTHRSREQQFRDWQRIRKALDEKSA